MSSAVLDRPNVHRILRSSLSRTAVPSVARTAVKAARPIQERPVVDIVRTSYDPKTKMVRVDRNGQVVSERVVRLKNATFVVTPGLRAGCVQSGSLGFIDGERITSGTPTAAFEAVRFDGTKFIKAEMNKNDGVGGLTPIIADTAREVVIDGGRMLALF